MNQVKMILVGITLLLVVCTSLLISPHLFTPANSTVGPHTEVLATTDMGNVSKEGPFGNPNSPVKIAYIVGVHPREYSTHEPAVNAVKKLDKSLKYNYTIYQINVTGGADLGYQTGRMNGQLLAKQYVVPDILKNDYQFVVDIHNNRGEEDNYKYSWFLYVPYNDERTDKIAQQLQGKIPGIVIYTPPVPTSPSYVTIPLIRNGTPAIIYEAYEFDSPETSQDLSERLLLAIDSLNLN